MLVAAAGRLLENRKAQRARAGVHTNRSADSVRHKLNGTEPRPNLIDKLVHFIE
jgi:hypothetical protein